MSIKNEINKSINYVYLKKNLFKFGSHLGPDPKIFGSLGLGLIYIWVFGFGSYIYLSIWVWIWVQTLDLNQKPPGTQAKMSGCAALVISVRGLVSGE